MPFRVCDLGYKRLVQVTIQKEDRTESHTKYILVSYQDHKSGKWRVDNFRELSGTTLENEVEAAEKDIGDAENADNQFKYAGYAYCCMLAGKLREARKASERAIALNNAHPDPVFGTDCIENIRIIKAILGEGL